ncbi:TPA: PLP-dependent aminotransferase family protein [Streptococcus suis]
MKTIYQKIIDDVLSGIQNHTYKRGQKLPSIRQLSKEYQCSKDTVQKAMLELKYQKKIYAVPKSGYYILEDQHFQDSTIDLDPDDFQELPYEDFRICLHESLKGRENYLFNYYHQQEGLAELITSVQTLFSLYHVYSKKSQLVITAGSQQALYILSQMDFGNGRDEILLEAPTYSRMLDLVVQQGLPYQTIDRNLNGIDLKKLEKIFQTGKIKFFYTIPRMHNPLGSSYDTPTRKAIVSLAAKYQVYLVEDDYLADFDPQHQVPLHYLDEENRTIYIKSFTPTLFPALRIGAISLPVELVSPFLQNKSLIDYDTNLIMQKALSLYIDNGMFARNTSLLVQNQERNRLKIEAYLAKSPIHFPYTISRNHLTLQVPKNRIGLALERKLKNCHIIANQHYDFLQLTLDEDGLAQLGDLQQLSD